MRRLLGCVAAVMMMLAGVVSPATAAETRIDVDLRDSNADLDAWRHGQAAVSAAAQVWPRLVASYLPACPGNDPNRIGRDNDCAAAGAMCADTPEPLDRMYIRFIALEQRDGRRSAWSPNGMVCLRREQVPGPGRPGFSVADFRRLPIPAGRAHVQPGDGQVLVNVPVNLYVDAKPVVLDTTLLGLDFQVRATPVRFVWDVGGGRTVETTDAGAAYPDLRVTYTYRQAGSSRITLTTVYSGEYRFAGSGWIPIDGTASVASPGVPVEVVEARAVLVNP